MVPIYRFLHKIKLDPDEVPEDYTLFYENEDSQELLEVVLGDLLGIEGSLMKVEQDGDILDIPLHRVRKVVKIGEIIWERTK